MTATSLATEGRQAIGALIAPRSIALVGASPSSYVGRVLCENLRSLRYEGPVYPVNPRHEEVMGWPCYPSVEAIPEPPDAVVAAIAFQRVPGVLRAAGERGTTAAVVPGGGFTETGPTALQIQEEIAAVAAGYGMAVCGPNCMGVIAPTHRSAMYIGTIPPTLLPGRVALLSQSGSVVEAAVNMGPRVGFSALVSCGNEAATTVGQYLQFFARDNETKAVTLFIEGFRDPTGFMEGARALRRAGKPLAVLQAGRSRESAAAIAAHSGSLAGTDEVVTGLLHQLGAIGVDDLDELFEVAELLGHGRLPKGRRLFVITDSGGEATLVADLARGMGLHLPPPSTRLAERLRARWPNFSYIGNPIDPWGVDPNFKLLYGEIVGASVDEDVDVVAVALDKVTTWAGENEVDLGLAAASALIAATSPQPWTKAAASPRAEGNAAPSAEAREKVPVFFTVNATGPAAAAIRDPLRAASVPLLHGLRPAMVALRRAWWWGSWKERHWSPVRTQPISLTFAEPGPILSERASRDILAAYGIPAVPAVAATTPEEAAEGAGQVGFPCVMKADVPGVAHKMAEGLVITGVATETAARAAYGRLLEQAATAGIRTRGALIEATATGVELICGMRHDPLFGPVVLLGVGGVLTEVLRQVAVRLCPVADEDLDEMLDECPAGRLLAGTGADPAPVERVVAALSCLALDHPEIREVDVNPLVAGPEGAVAADALVVIDLDRPAAWPDQGSAEGAPPDRALGGPSKGAHRL